MIKCNLAVLLAERNMKISDLAKRTGISRTTLTALVQNQGKGVQFDTLDTLCNFLNVSPSDLFLHIPFEYYFSIKESTFYPNKTYNYLFNIQAEIKYNHREIKTSFECQVAITLNSTPLRIEVYAKYSSDIIYGLKDVPKLFLTSMDNELLEEIVANLAAENDLDENEITATISTNN